MAHADIDSPPLDRSTRWSATELLCLGAVTTAVGAVSFSQTLSVPLIPYLTDHLDANVANVSWIATSTLIASAVVSPIVGRMGDMYGKRWMAIGCMTVTLVGCLLGMVSDTLAPLIVARVLQGVGAGAIPVGFGIIRDQLATRHLVVASSAIMVGGAGIGAGAGPIAASALISRWGSEAGFAAATAVVAVSIVLLVVGTRGTDRRYPARFDIVGALGLSVVLVATMLALTRGATWGWTSPITLSLVVGGFGLLWWWVRWERSANSPMVDIEASSSGPVLIAHLGGMVAGFSTFAQYLVVVTLVTRPASTGYGLGRTLASAGLIQLPGVLALAAALLGAAPVIRRWGARRVLTVSSLVLGIGFVVGIFFHDSPAQIIIGLIVINIGLGPVYCVLPVLILETVEPSATSAVNAANSLARQTGSVVATAFTGMILAALVGTDGEPREAALNTIYVLAAVAAIAVSVATVALGRRFTRQQGATLNVEHQPT